MNQIRDNRSFHGWDRQGPSVLPPRQAWCSAMRRRQEFTELTMCQQVLSDGFRDPPRTGSVEVDIIIEDACVPWEHGGEINAFDLACLAYLEQRPIIQVHAPR